MPAIMPMWEGLQARIAAKAAPTVGGGHAGDAGDYPFVGGGRAGDYP